METKHVIIKGKVQGVFYRTSAKKKAEELSLSGWIKNTSEGDVEAIVTGNNQQLQEFVKWCKSGPDRAKVDEVDVNNHELEDFDSFRIVR